MNTRAFFDLNWMIWRSSRNIKMGIKKLQLSVDLIEREKAAVEAAILATNRLKKDATRIHSVAS